ncbi:hypothetical protein [Amycolatopsis sp. H20-H5]|uniref:hypothetical protein n=1 Tax=Amycolatopsis sp. H20-H5 TaxID=3046309 RepID=UPI002DBE4A28|nr:hypothetical protein [Amycolatopsis sp. H20-H5]MEC3977765.1 hypothetical protein [Amycolatopsis sp. H20-H5]
MTDRPNMSTVAVDAEHVSVVVAHRGTILVTSSIPQSCAEPDWSVPGTDVEAGTSITAAADRVMAQLRPGGPQVDWAHLGQASLVTPDGRDVRSAVVLGYVQDRAEVGADLAARVWRTPLRGLPACPGIDEVLKAARLLHDGASALFAAALDALVDQLAIDTTTLAALAPPRNAAWRRRQHDAVNCRTTLLTLDLNACRRGGPSGSRQQPS